MGHVGWSLHAQWAVSMISDSGRVGTSGLCDIFGINFAV
jgi:hypothetical protein